MAGTRRARNQSNSIAIPRQNSTSESGKTRQNLNAESLASMNKEQLRAECRKRGQRSTGNKNELLARLGYYKLAATVQPEVEQKARNGLHPPKEKEISVNNKVKISNSQPAMDSESLVLWRRPITTLDYFFRELFILVTSGLQRLLAYKLLALSIVLAISGTAVSYYVNGPHQPYVQEGVWTLAWWGWWVVLGVCSSVGLGTGLHTFLLYLGPHIARVTLAAYECGGLNFPQPPYPNEVGFIGGTGGAGLFVHDDVTLRHCFIALGLFWCVILGVCSPVGLGTGLHTFLLYLGPHIARVTLAAYECGGLNFPQPPYPNDIICPEVVDPAYAVSIWNIMAKVRVESMMWGIGTALGELPPYFMARAARLSGKKDELANELEVDADTFVGRAKLMVQRLVQRVGFAGILACASVPNPLFDLAGLTCGHFLVPFWTFFGATLVGKAVVKMHIQKMFVIVAFNESLVGQALAVVSRIPYIGPKLEQPLLEFLRNQKAKLHKNDSGSPVTENTGSVLSSLLEKFVLTMVVYFVVSIVNALAQNYSKRVGKKKGKKRE